MSRPSAGGSTSWPISATGLSGCPSATTQPPHDGTPAARSAPRPERDPSQAVRPINDTEAQVSAVLRPGLSLLERRMCRSGMVDMGAADDTCLVGRDCGSGCPVPRCLVNAACGLPLGGVAGQASIQAHLHGLPIHLLDGDQHASRGTGVGAGATTIG